MSPSEWPKVRIVDIAAAKRWALNGGPFGSKLTTKDYTASGVPVIRGTNLSGRGRFSFDDFVYVTEEKADELLANNAHPGDLVFTQRGTIGQVGLIPRGSAYPRFVISQSQMKLTPDESRVDPEFLYFVFVEPGIVRRIQDLAFAAGVPHINLEILRQFEIALPPLGTQRRIASLLSSYDKSITGTLRRIQILEEMARAIYREWFVYFRFPGNPGEGRVVSPLGAMPVGWTRKRLGVLTSKIGSGATPRGGKGSYKASGIPLIRSLNIYDYRFELSDLAFLDGTQAELLQQVTVTAGDVLLNITGASVGRCCMVPSWVVPARVNQHVAIVRANRDVLDPYYLLDSINDEFNKRRLLSVAQGGATREALTKETISNFTLILPPPDLMARYGEVAGPIHNEREVLARLCDNLRATRDLLLPRLMSGQLTLPEAEEAIPASL